MNHSSSLLKKKPVVEDLGPSWSYDAKAVEIKIRTWFKDLTEPQISAILQYSQAVVDWSGKVELIGPQALRTIESTHLADSILASRVIGPMLDRPETIHDLGSGHGLPGLIFSILYPQHQVVLVERDPRRIVFFHYLIEELALKNVSILECLTDDLAPDSVAVGFYRGAGTLTKTLMTARKFSLTGSVLYHFKTDGWANELAQLPSQLFGVWSTDLAGQYKIPGTASGGAVIVTKRTGI